MRHQVSGRVEETFKATDLLLMGVGGVRFEGVEESSGIDARDGVDGDVETCCRSG